MRTTTHSVPGGLSEIKESTSNMASGMYFLKLTSEDFEETYKIIVL
jgi:hypothetical protein